MTDLQYRKDYKYREITLMNSSDKPSKDKQTKQKIPTINNEKVKSLTIQEILEATKTLKNNKTSGIDNILAEFFKSGRHDIIVALYSLIINILHQEQLFSE